MERVFVKFCFKTRKSAPEIYELKIAYRDKCLNWSNIFIRLDRFKDGCESVLNDLFPPPPNSGKPPTSTINENIVKVCDLACSDSSSW